MVGVAPNKALLGMVLTEGIPAKLRVLLNPRAVGITGGLGELLIPRFDMELNEGIPAKPRELLNPRAEGITGGLGELLIPRFKVDNDDNNAVGSSTPLGKLTLFITLGMSGGGPKLWT